MNLILAFSISSLPKYFLILLIFLSPNNSGIKHTFNGHILDNPSAVILSIGMYLSIKSKGQLPSNLYLHKLLM